MSKGVIASWENCVDRFDPPQLSTVRGLYSKMVVVVWKESPGALSHGSARAQDGRGGLSFKRDLLSALSHEQVLSLILNVGMHKALQAKVWSVLRKVYLSMVVLIKPDGVWYFEQPWGRNWQ
jgi:hypothetical protein